MTLQECYQAAGADYDDVLRRFRTDERVARFLSIFLRDESYDQLCRAMQVQDYKEAFRAVHTMKGICLNLSLSDLLAACVALTEDLRGGQAGAGTAQCFTNVQAAYAKTGEAIRAYLATGENSERE